MNAPISIMRARQQLYPDWASALVHRYLRYSTRNLTDLQAHMRSTRSGAILSIDRPEDFVGYNEMRLPMGRLVLSMGCIEARNGYELSYRCGDEYVVTVPSRGNGWISTGDLSIEYGLGDIMIIAPFCAVDKHWEGPSELLSIYFPADRFDEAAARLGLSALTCAPILRIDNRHLRSFLRVVDMICLDLQDSDGPSPLLRAPLSDHTEQMLLTLLLQGVDVAAGTKAEAAGTSPARPYYVRRAERFIAANAHLSIGIDEIAKACGMSIRTMQYGFRVFLNTTPMQYLKQMRYQRAREILLLENSNSKISDIAANIGCANVSQFSRDYRSMFGETPSETMLRAAGKLPRDENRKITPDRSSELMI